MARGIWVLAAAGAFSVALAGAGQAAERTLRVYHIGNSLTRGMTPGRLHLLVEARGIDYQFGAQLAGGAVRLTGYGNSSAQFPRWFNIVETRILGK